jgi:hypothetical protein
VMKGSNCIPNIIISSEVGDSHGGDYEDVLSSGMWHLIIW